MSKIELLYQVKVEDNKTGKLVSDTGLKPCHSFVKQFLQMLENILHHEHETSRADAIATLDTSNTSRNLTINYTASSTPSCARYMGIDAPTTDDTYGIVVGTDNTAETNTDYVLGTQIAHGSGAGQLVHGSHSWVTSSVVGANVDLVVSRTFTNSSGGAITIEEVALYTKSGLGSTTAGDYIFMLIRDTTGGSTVNNGQTATVSYTFRTTA